MLIAFSCEHCGKELHAFDYLVGRGLLCPQCNTLFKVPAVGAGNPPARLLNQTRSVYETKTPAIPPASPPVDTSPQAVPMGPPVSGLGAPTAEPLPTEPIPAQLEEFSISEDMALPDDAAEPLAADLSTTSSLDAGSEMLLEDAGAPAAGSSPSSMTGSSPSSISSVSGSSLDTSSGSEFSLSEDMPASSASMSPPSFTSGLDAGSSSEVSELDSSSGSEFSLDSPPSSTSGMDVSSDFELPATDAAASGVSAGGSDDFGITEEMAMADAAGPGSHTSGEEEVFSLDELEAKEEEPEPPKKKKKK